MAIIISLSWTFKLELNVIKVTLAYIICNLRALLKFGFIVLTANGSASILFVVFCLDYCRTTQLTCSGQISSWNAWAMCGAHSKGIFLKRFWKKLSA